MRMTMTTAAVGTYMCAKNGRKLETWKLVVTWVLVVPKTEPVDGSELPYTYGLTLDDMYDETALLSRNEAGLRRYTTKVPANTSVSR